MINININNKCNQFCVFCETQKFLSENNWKSTTDGDIKKQIEEASKKSSSINFTGGGEPTMVKKLPELIRFAKFLGLKSVCMETNGLLLSYFDYLKKLKDNGLDSCIISLHSNKEEISDLITQKPGSFKLTIKGMNNLIKLNIPIRSVYFTITRLNYKDIKGFIMYIYNRFKVENFWISFIRPLDSSVKSKGFTPRISEVINPLFDAIDYCKDNDIKIVFSPNLGIPLCFLENYEEYSGELKIYINHGNSEIKKIRDSYNKFKPDKCNSCSFSDCCSGIPKNYVNIYGTGELLPVKKSLKNIIDKYN